MELVKVTIDRAAYSDGAGCSDGASVSEQWWSWLQ